MQGGLGESLKAQGEHYKEETLQKESGSAGGQDFNKAATEVGQEDLISGCLFCLEHFGFEDKTFPEGKG